MARGPARPESGATLAMEAAQLDLYARNADVVVDTPMPPPRWALLERLLIDAQTAATQEFYDRYFDERGYLECYPRWGGDDGPDDAAENFAHWTELYALGAPKVILDLYRKAWEGHLRQYTEAKTTHVPFARDGMYYREFPVMFDWAHNGEGFVAFWLEGLTDPYQDEFQRRTRRYAGMYMNEDPMSSFNYDPDRRLIRSMFNGSRGPMMRKTTALDWAGDPFEVEGRYTPMHGERNYQEMLDHFKDYNDVAGDHPLNLNTTTLALNAYMLDGEPKYRDWAVGYLDAWVERTRANGGIVPSNIGLDGTIGGECGGRWYGGVYGWAHSTINPVDQGIRHRPFFHSRASWGFANGLLLTGDVGYIDAWRSTLDGVNANAKVVDGVTMYPRMHGDDGWYDFQPEPFEPGALHVYYWSMDPADRGRVPQDPWLDFLEGNNPDFPVQALEDGLEVVRDRVERLRADMSTPDTRLCDDMNNVNPAQTDILTQLMLGGLEPGHCGYPLHARVRYFDPERRRPGLPEDVAALVETLSAGEATVSLVNLDQVRGHTVIVQGGAYGEHRVTGVTVDGRTTPVNRSSFSVRLAPGCGAKLVVKADRYVIQPTFAFPWA